MKWVDELLEEPFGEDRLALLVGLVVLGLLTLGFLVVAVLT